MCTRPLRRVQNPDLRPGLGRAASRNSNRKTRPYDDCTPRTRAQIVVLHANTPPAEDAHNNRYGGGGGGGRGKGHRVLGYRVSRSRTPPPACARFTSWGDRSGSIRVPYTPPKPADRLTDPLARSAQTTFSARIVRSYDLAGHRPPARPDPNAAVVLTVCTRGEHNNASPCGGVFSGGS